MVEIKSFVSKFYLTIANAMQQINKNAVGILFLLDEDDKLVACITDGDIRRFLLAGGKMYDLAILAANKSPRMAKSREEAQKLYHKRNYAVIPIVDTNLKIIDLYFGEDERASLTKRNHFDIPVVINAGGKGTRLDPFTRVLPKPLIPVGDIPIIERIMMEYQDYFGDKFHIIVNYKRDLIKAYFAESDANYDITWYDETIPLGTGGGLSLLKDHISDSFFFANCDSLLVTDFNDVMKYHKENRNVITMICASKSIRIPYGVVKTDEFGGIIEMSEKPEMTYLTNTGIYIVEPEVIDDIEVDTYIDFPDVIEKERELGKKVSVFTIEESDWMDMGQLPELEKMRNKLGYE